MTFWLDVGLGYLLLLAVGTAIGAYLGSRRRRGGGGGMTEPVSPEPFGPTHALDCPPLGSAFDRALLPGAFDDPLRQVPDHFRRQPTACRGREVAEVQGATG